MSLSEQSIDRLYEIISVDQRELLHRMAALSPSFPRWAVEKIAIVPQGPRDDGLRRWSIDFKELLGLSLLEAAIWDDPSIDRYRLPEGVRGYVIVRAGPSGMEPHLRRAASLYLAYAMQYAEDHDALLLEVDGMMAGMDWACRAMASDREDAEDARRMVCLYAWSLARPGCYLEGRPEMMARWLKSAVVASERLFDKEAEIAFLRYLAETCATPSGIQPPLEDR